MADAPLALLHNTLRLELPTPISTSTPSLFQSKVTNLSQFKYFFTNLGFIKISLILFSPGSFFVINLLYVYICVLPAFSSVHHLHAWRTQRPEESVRPTGIGMALGCQPPCV